MSEIVFGPKVSKAKIQKVIQAHLALWMPTYLCEADEDEGLERGFTAWPQSWQKTPKFNNELDKQLPAMLVISPGTVDKPYKEGDGSYRATYAVGIASLVKGPDQEAAGEIAGRYGAAIQACMTQQKGQLGPHVFAVAWMGDKYDDIAISAERTLASVTVSFDITFRGIINDKLGPGRPIYQNPSPNPKEKPKEESSGGGPEDKGPAEEAPIIPDDEHIHVEIVKES